ncbi:hypothetical protein EJC49_19635 [Aquibium carbonis]|uniref:Uncharacterized protein n=1 Tax=Aquibium carbonis TaxID=2495581 RepID=A0A3R9Y5G2_9HYPH|nr:hypothetical protein [Aquibium carbonis]RST84662.1 hypothetical protein EJC49_19635 [Aquibium carbonis]
MASRKSHEEEAAEKAVRQEIRSKDNARYLQSMPNFKLEDVLPQRLASLLADLSRAENGRQAGVDQSGALGAASGPQRK